MSGRSNTWRLRAVVCSAITVIAACGGSDTPAADKGPSSVGNPSAVGSGGKPALANTGLGGNSTGMAGAAGKGSPGGTSGGGSGGAGPVGTGGKMAMGTGGGSSVMMPLPPFMGPLDGDPSKPMVEIPGVACGVPTIGFGSTPPGVKITDRDVAVAYPCAHEGAAVTFFLFLHGTLMDDAQKVPFTMNAWPIHKLVDSHNIIVVAPKAVGSQWGNGDNGVDLPHLYEVVDWVYATFGEKFNIRSMWAQGGSWGAAYLAGTFACDPKFESRLKGIQLVVGGGCPSCANRMSCVVAQQELQLGNGDPLSPEQREMSSSGAAIETYATMHGCDAKTGPTDVGNTKAWYWENCDKGWTHSYYMGPGQHADAWDPMAVLKTTDDIKKTEE